MFRRCIIHLISVALLAARTSQNGTADHDYITAVAAVVPGGSVALAGCTEGDFDTTGPLGSIIQAAAVML